MRTKIYRHSAAYRVKIYGYPVDYWAKIEAGLDIYLRDMNLVYRQRLQVILDAASLVLATRRLPTQTPLLSFPLDFRPSALSATLRQCIGSSSGHVILGSIQHRKDHDLRCLCCNRCIKP